MDREFFEANIDSETCTPNWYAGDKMDWNMAVRRRQDGLEHGGVGTVLNFFGNTD
jgi:hypothetical protein